MLLMLHIFGEISIFFYSKYHKKLYPMFSRCFRHEGGAVFSSRQFLESAHNAPLIVNYV